MPWTKPLRSHVDVHQQQWWRRTDEGLHQGIHGVVRQGMPGRAQIGKGAIGRLPRLWHWGLLEGHVRKGSKSLPELVQYRSITARRWQYVRAGDPKRHLQCDLRHQLPDTWYHRYMVHCRWPIVLLSWLRLLGAEWQNGRRCHRRIGNFVLPRPVVRLDLHTSQGSK